MRLLINLFLFSLYTIQLFANDWILSSSTNTTQLYLVHQKDQNLFFQNSSGNELYQFNVEQDSLSLLQRTTNSGHYYTIQDNFLHIDQAGSFSLNSSEISQQNTPHLSFNDYIGNLNNHLYFFTSQKVYKITLSDNSIFHEENELEADRVILSGNTFFKFKKDTTSNTYTYTFTKNLSQLNTLETYNSTLTSDHELVKIVQSEQEKFFLLTQKNNSNSVYSIDSNGIIQIELNNQNIQSISFHTYFNCLMAFYSDSEKSYLSTLKNNQWTHLELSHYLPQATALLNNTDNFLICISSQQKLTQNNPNLIFNLEYISGSPDYQQTHLIWNNHPIHNNYTILYNDTEIQNTQFNSYTYPSRIQQNDSFKINTKTNGFESSLTWTYQASGVSNLEYYLPKYQDNTSLSLWSFPANTSIIDNKEEPLIDYLERYLGNDYNPSIWKIGTFLPANNNYIEGKDLQTLNNASGYWLASQFHLSFTIQYPEPTNTYQLYLLEPGWNLLGAYFNTTSLTTSLVLEDGFEWNFSMIEASKTPPIQPHFWEWSQGEYQSTTSMNLSKGYWIKNNRDTRLILKLIESKQKSFISVLSKSSLEQPPSPPSFNQTNNLSNTSGGGGCFLK